MEQINILTFVCFVLHNKWQRIDAFELCCWRRLLRVPWTARKSTLNILGRTDAETDANQLLWPCDVKSQLFGKDPDTGKDWRQEKETTVDKMVGWHHWLNGANFGRWWRTENAGVLQSMGLQKVGHNWVLEQQQKHLFVLYYIINFILKFKNKLKISYMEI